MNSVLEEMVGRSKPKNNEERRNAIKEAVQQIVLAGLSNAGFFKVAAFYGGTCLRLFHELDRFSEDLDFALLHPDPSFSLAAYLPAVQKELLSYGLEADIVLKEKTSDSAIQSAFLKGNTLEWMMAFFPKSEEAKRVVMNQSVKVKLEIDVDNPSGYYTDSAIQMYPNFYDITLFDETSLFSGKVHALICRNYKNRVKGRDYYDYLFYLSKGVKLNLIYLRNKLINSGKIEAKDPFDLAVVKKMLKTRFEETDFEAAVIDVKPFLRNVKSLAFWNKDFFLSSLDRLK